MEKNKIGLLLLLLLIAFSDGFSQVAPQRYLVYFNNKVNSPYSIDQPEEFLSTRAIQRRLDQGIAVTETDIPVNPQYVNAVSGIDNVSVIYRLKWFNAVLIETGDPFALDLIELLPMVNYYEREQYFDFNYEVELGPVNSDLPKSGEEYGPSLNQIEMLNGLYLHDEGFKGAGKIVAVLDAGYLYLEEALAFANFHNNNLLIDSKDFIDGDDFVNEGSTHGTMVLSCMAGFLIDSLIGTSPEAEYVLLRTENSSYERRIEEANWAAAAEYADSIGVDVINTSLGYTDFDVNEESYTYADMDGNTTLISRASQLASERGMLVVNSAGNSGNLPWHYISAPADAPGVLAVGSVNGNEIVSSFSSRGPSADGRVKPNVMARGQAAIVTDLDDGIISANGTSFASPIMAGMATSLWSKHPTVTSVQLFDAIEQSAHLYLNPNDSMGYGIPDFAIADQILGALSSVGSLKGSADFNVYPNPFTHQITIELNSFKNEDVIIRIIAIDGKVVFEEHHENNEGNKYLNLRPDADLALGAYVVHLTSSLGNQARKILFKTHN